MDEFLKDQVFLDQLDALPLKNQYVKITVLTWQEEPIKEIQGKIISGSLNLNGSSSLRRTANLTMFAEEQNNDLTQINEDLSINRKIKLEVGFDNTVPPHTFTVEDKQTKEAVSYIINYQQRYGERVWFPLGIYVIFDPNISHGTNGVNISVSLKDKMCLLNGDAGGKIPASTEFHLREQEDEDGVVTVDHPLIIQIIQECVHHWGAEDPAKIIITDLDNRIKQVVRWLSDAPLYYVQTVNTEGYYLDYNEAVEAAHGNENLIKIIEYGDEAGFIITDFTYPGELIGDAGETVTGVLDKIIGVLGNFEYFYDVYGNFRFQEIKNYLNITYTTQLFKDQIQYGQNFVDKVNYDVDLAGGKALYSFKGSKLISSFSNAPKYSNIKNDFVVWGIRKTASGVETPIRYHLAIDARPQPQYGMTLASLQDQAAAQEEGRYFNENQANYEEYYQDHKNIVFYEDDFGVTRAKIWLRTTDEEEEQGETFRTYDWREELYMQGVTASSTGSDYSYYFTELVNEWPKLWDFKEHKFKQSVADRPGGIDFFLDLLDINSEVGKYSVQNIGRRSEIVSEDKINCVFEQEVPDVIFINRNDENSEELENEARMMGQTIFQVDEEIYELLAIGGVQNSCYQRVCEMLYQFTNMNESITIQAIPMYYLEPNTRINVQDPASGIYGDFMIQSISLPLSIEGTMNITASKALQKI